MNKNKDNKILLKLFFNKFKYISFIISLIMTLLLLNFFVKRVNTLNISVEFVNSQFNFEKYSNFNNQQPNNSQRYVVLDLESLIKTEKSESIVTFLGFLSDSIFLINKELNLNKINLEIKKKNILYDLNTKIITVTFIQTYSFFNYRELSEDETSETLNIMQKEINKILIQNKLPIKSIVTLKNYHQDISIYYKIFSSVFLLTFFFNFVYALIKYRKIFF